MAHWLGSIWGRGLLAWAVLALAPLAWGEEAAPTFRAGAAAVDITPQTLPVIVNGGFSERLIDQVTDPLHARALVLDDGATRLAIVTVDSCLVPRELIDKAKALASAETQIPTERMLVSATHAHSAPAVAGALGSGVQEDYAAWLPGRIAQAIAEANRNLAPARVGWGVDADPNNVFVRRWRMKPGTATTVPFTGAEANQAQMNPGYENPNKVEQTGKADTAVSVLAIAHADGRPLALWANYSTHYVGAPGISADYFGVFAQRMMELLQAGQSDPPFVAALTNGTSGDANSVDFTRQRKFDRFSVAEDVAQAAMRAYAKITWHDRVPLAMAEQLLTLGVRMPSADEVAQAKEYLQANLPADGKPRNMPTVYARETVILSELPPTRELKLQAIRIGELGIAAIPCEVYSCTGLAIKEASPLTPTFNISLANGCEGYLPPAEQFSLGGYTTWRARTSCLETAAEEKIRTTVLAMLEELAKGK